jgi:hypothetical protein
VHQQPQKFKKNATTFDRCESWGISRRDIDLDGYDNENESRQPAVIIPQPSNNNIVIDRRPALTRPVIRPPIYKEEDNYEEEDKKKRPVERFQFANNRNFQNPRTPQQRN